MAVTLSILFVTDGGSKVLPAGSFTVSELLVPLVIMPEVAPKNTILLDGTVSKLVPVMVTLVPTAPEAGEKPVIPICAISKLLLPESSIDAISINILKRPYCILIFEVCIPIYLN